MKPKEFIGHTVGHSKPPIVFCMAQEYCDRILFNGAILSVPMFFFFGAGCASPDPAGYGCLRFKEDPPTAAEMSVQSEDNSVDDYRNIEVPQKATEEVKCEIADPQEPFNRAMYHFNRKPYFWLLKPVAQGYQKVVSEVLWYEK